MIIRRTILVVAASFVVTGRACAQRRIHRMGYLGASSAEANAPYRAAFSRRLYVPIE